LFHPRVENLQKILRTPEDPSDIYKKKFAEEELETGVCTKEGKK
jgi:hypothetical protein